MPQKSLASQPVIPSEAALGTTRNLFVAPRFLACKKCSLGMTKASFAPLRQVGKQTRKRGDMLQASSPLLRPSSLEACFEFHYRIRRDSDAAQLTVYRVVERVKVAAACDDEVVLCGQS